MILDPAGLLDDVRVRNLGLSKSAEQLLPVVAAMPLASVVDYAAVVGKTPSYFYPRLRELEKKGWLTSVSLGATKPRALHWFLTQEGINRLSIFSPHWHEESALGRLLERLPMVEWFYQASVGLPGLGELEHFSWFNDVAWDAAARYRDGWAAFFWSGVMQRESRVKETFAKLGEDLVHHSVLGRIPILAFCALWSVILGSGSWFFGWPVSSGVPMSCGSGACPTAPLRGAGNPGSAGAGCNNCRSVGIWVAGVGNSVLLTRTGRGNRRSGGPGCWIRWPSGRG